MQHLKATIQETTMKTTLILALIAGAVLRSDAQTACGDDVEGACGLEPLRGLNLKSCLLFWTR